jgi:hypothetical protein
VRLLERAQVPMTSYRGYVCCDIDTFAMDNSGTRKEAVSRTYQGFDGYTPIAAYLGNEGWNIGLELRPGAQHSARKTEYFYERVFPRLERLVPAHQPVLLREDSGLDSVRLLWAKATECARLQALGRSFDFICKWNPRQQDKGRLDSRGRSGRGLCRDSPWPAYRVTVADGRTRHGQDQTTVSADCPGDRADSRQAWPVPVDAGH